MYPALDRSRLATISEIAAAYGISQNHLMKVVHHLARTGVIASGRGKGGGAAARPSSGGDPHRRDRASIEGHAPIVECLSGDPDACCISGACRLTRALVDAFDALYASLDRHTPADLAGNRRALTMALVQPPAPLAASRRRGRARIADPR